MYWHLVYTKPRQEELVLQNLRQQGYQAYLPTFPIAKICQGPSTVINVPLFPRYLFVRVPQECPHSYERCASIAHIKGVSRLVNSGQKPVKIENSLISYFQARESAIQGKPPYLGSSDKVSIAVLESLYETIDGPRRVMALIELLSTPAAPFMAKTGTT